MTKPLRPALADALPKLPRVEQVPPAPMRETDDEKADRERTSRLHRHNRYLRRMPKRYARAMLIDLTEAQNPERKVSGWLNSGHQTLLLASTRPGLGKTHAAYAVGSEAVHRGLVVEAYTAMEMLSALRPNRLDPEAPDRVEGSLLSCDLLVLDDLGRERLTDWGQERTHHVLSTRLGNSMRTVITTNLTGEEMGTRYGYPLYDRVLDDAVVVKVTGESRRRPAAW